MKLYDKFIYFAFIYLIYRNKWVLVESTDTSSTPPASSGGATDSSNKTGVELSLKKTSGTNEFDYNKVGNIVTYTAKNDYAFKSVKTGDTVVWSTTNASEYASKVVLDGKGKKEKKVTIHLPNNTTKVYKRAGKDKPWTDVSPQPKDTAKTSGTTPSSGANGSGTITGIGVNIGSGVSTDKFQCNKNGLCRTYTPKGNNAFNLVGEFIDRKPVFVWKSSGDSEYSSKVEVYLMSGQPKVVTVYLKDNTKLFEKKSDNKTWETIDTEKVNPRSLNIKYEHSSYFCNNELKNKVRTFTAKSGFAFKLVYEFIDQKNRPEIWTTDKESEYANKVEVEGGNKVTIHTANGTAKVFNKGTDNKWTEDAASSKKGSSTDGSGGGSSPVSKPATQ